MAKPALVTIFALCLALPVCAQEGEPHGPEVPADLKLYGEASLLMHRRDHSAALGTLDTLLAEHPQTRMKVAAQFFRAQCLEELGRLDDAKGAYDALVAEHPKSGWAEDAAGRLRALARPAPVFERGALRTVQLANGDRISGRVVFSGEDRVEIESDGVGRVVMPRKDLTFVGRSRKAPLAASFAPQGDRQERILSLLAGDGADTVIEIDDDEETTVVEKDGTKTTTRIHKDGSKTITTVTETEDGKKRVVIERHLVDGRKGPKKGRRIELELELDDVDVERDLEDLPKKIKLEIRKHLDDLDLDLEGLEDLEGLGDKIRKQVHEHLEQGGAHGKHALEFLHELHGDDEDENVFILKGDRLKQRLKGWKADGEEWRKHMQVWKDKAGSWPLPDLHLGDGEHRVEVYRGGPGAGPGRGYAFFGDGGPKTFFAGSTKEDRVFLRNGDKISGTLQRVTADHVEMKTSYGEVKIKRDQVRQITFKRKAPAPKPHLGVFLTGEDDKPGVTVGGVVEGSAAEKAGLRKGDVIKSIGDAAVTNHATLRAALESHKVGETVTLGVERDGKTLQLEATLAASSGAERVKKIKKMIRMRAPEAPHAPMAPHAPKAPKRILERILKRRGTAPKAGGRPFLGISCDDRDGKLVVTGTVEGGSVHGILEEGDVITRFNGKAVTGSADLVAQINELAPGDQVTLELRRGEVNLKIVVPLSARSGEELHELHEAPQVPQVPKARTLRKY